MKRKDDRVKRSLLSLRSFLIFFGLTAFTVTCCMLLFLDGSGISEERIREKAGLTFANVVVLSGLFTLIDFLRRDYSVRCPLNRIREATEKMRQGDFSIRVERPKIPAFTNEIDVIAEDINKLAEELSGVETLRTDFIANVSHEIKTPLAIIQNYAAMLQDNALTEELRTEYVKTLTEATRRLSDLITNILKLNRLENQRIYPQARRFNLSEQLCECLLTYESIWEEKAIRIETDIKPDIMIEGDSELLALVWNNLLSNAMKFTDRGGTVSVAVRRDGSAVAVTIADTGCGITPEAGKHIFEKFYQGDPSHGTQGNGLGLALVKRIMDILQGEISVQSEVGKGSRFSVRLERADVDAERAAFG